MRQDCVRAMGDEERTAGGNRRASETDLIAVFDALSRPGRLAVFRSVVRAADEGLDASALARELRTTGSALTLHLRRLSEAGLIRHCGRGRFVADLGRLRLVLATLELGCADQPSTSDR